MDERSSNSSNLVAQLKGKLWYCVEKQVSEETPFDTSYTPQFTNALVEMCYMQLVEMGKDLEAFAHHGGRQVISREDMRLLLRKTPQLEDLIVPK